MAFPDWVVKNRPPHSEVRLLKGVYYVYRISSKWNPEKKRAQKITHELLGKITEKEGFVSSAKRSLEKQVSTPPVIKEYGAFFLFEEIARDEISALKEFFPSLWEDILALSYLRLSHHSPLKLMPVHWDNCYGSVRYGNKISSRSASELLSSLGERRGDILEYKRRFFTDKSCLLVDSTHIFSDSSGMAINNPGYNSAHEYRPQVNMIYIFSTHDEPLPVYYRIIDGSIREVRAFRLCLLESGITSALIIGDKGFYSKPNRDALEEEEIQYILPLRRNYQGIDYSPAATTGRTAIADYFFYNDRVIWHYSYSIEGRRVVTYLDEQLRVQESHDYLQRISSHPEEYSMEGYNAKHSRFGTITLITNNDADSPKTLFEYFKARNNIEQVFDTFKNLFNADRTYMRNEKSLEGWLFIHFIVMRVYYKLLFRLKKNNLLSQYSPEDLFNMAKYVKKMKIMDNWMTSEVNKKLASVTNKIGLPIT